MACEQTQAQWCAENDVNIHTFRYWKKRLGETIDQKQSDTLGFVSLKPAIRKGHSVTVRIGAACIDISDATNLSLLENVVEVLMRYA